MKEESHILKNLLDSPVLRYDSDTISRYLASETGKKEAHELRTMQRCTIWSIALRDVIRTKTTTQGIFPLLMETIPESIYALTGLEPGFTPMHMAISYRPMLPNHVLHQMILSIASRVPKLRLVKTGGTLLHYAARCGLTKPTLKLIYDCYPAAAYEKDLEGQLPLHVILNDRSQFSHPRDIFEAVSFLMSVNPEAVQARNSHGWLPLHVVSCRERVLFDHGTILEITRSLYDSCPKAVQSLTTEGGCTPLTLACRMPKLTGAEKVVFLLEKYPNAAVIRDTQHGKIPFQYFRPSECVEYLKVISHSMPGANLSDITDECGNNVAHLVAMTLKKSLDTSMDAQCTSRLIKGMAREFPELFRARNSRGELPLHLRLKAGQWKEYLHIDVVNMMGRYIESIIMQDGVTGLFPFMLAATGKVCCLTTTYHALQSFIGTASLNHF